MTDDARGSWGQLQRTDDPANPLNTDETEHSRQSGSEANPRLTYRARREARAARLREWAVGRGRKAEAAYEQSAAMASVIPFGQPILVGHHSEGRDRNYRGRIAAAMDRSVEHQHKAGSMTLRAQNIESALNSSIYSDDPDAVERLREKLEKLEAEREGIKVYNTSCRKGRPDSSTLSPKWLARLDQSRRIAGMLRPNGAIPAYGLTNLAAEIRRTRKRIAELAQSGHGYGG